MYVHKTPPTPPQSTPFPGLILKVGKINYSLGKMDPNWAKCLKSGKTFLEVGTKKLFMDPIGPAHPMEYIQEAISFEFSSPALLCCLLCFADL